jgi:hypothetical protein
MAFGFGGGIAANHHVVARTAMDSPTFEVVYTICYIGNHTHASQNHRARLKQRDVVSEEQYARRIR